jgi:hypothetical protein
MLRTVLPCDVGFEHNLDGCEWRVGIGGISLTRGRDTAVTLVLPRAFMLEDVASASQG